jgi:hypothetical protein
MYDGIRLQCTYLSMRRGSMYPTNLIRTNTYTNCGNNEVIARTAKVAKNISHVFFAVYSAMKQFDVHVTGSSIS